MTSAHHHHSRFTTPNERRLPSIKDLNFQYRSPQGNLLQTELPTSQQQETPRHSSAWGSRNQPVSNQSVPQHHQQHTPPLSAGHDTAKELEYPSKQENGGYIHPGIPLSAQVTPLPGAVNIGNPRGDDSPNQLKRPRTASTNVTVSRDVRPSHATYPQPQYTSYPPASQPPTPSPYIPIPSNLPGQPSQTSHAAPPPPHEQMQHHPMTVSAHPGYAPYQHAYMQARQPVMHPQHPQQPTPSNPYPSPGPPPPAPPSQGPWIQTHPQQQHPPQPTSHQLPPPPPPQQQHAQHPQHILPHHQQSPMSAAPSHIVQHHHNQPPHQNSQPPIQHHSLQQPPQQQFQPQQQQLPFARTTAIVPTNVDTRGSYPVNEPERHSSTRNNTLMEIAHRCLILHQFASRYAQQPHVQPSASELQAMSQHALTIVRLLEELQRMNLSEGEETGIEPDPMHQSPDDPRPPKRPWEDISQEEGASMPDPSSFADQYASGESKPQTTAEQDMELIRTKRATSTAGTNGSAGQPKSKYRKRSRATPPGKCHSCNIRETPEWRRGPDGARTLCNACGLHYAKLMRKRDKNGNGEVPHIDLETLRASARAADIATAEKTHSRSAKQGSRSHQSEPTSPMNTAKQPPQHHEGSFQLVNMIAPDPSSSTMSTETSRVPPSLTQQPSMAQPSTALPPPPWSTNLAPPATGGTRTYAQPDHIQQQSFMRSSQHSSLNHAPPR